MIVVPNAFIEDPAVPKILLNGQNTLIEKVVTAPKLDNERFVKTHALTYVRSGELKVKTDYATITVRQGYMVYLPIGIYMLSDIIPAGSRFEAQVFCFDEKLARRFLEQEERVFSTGPANPVVFKVSQNMDESIAEIYKSYPNCPERSATNWKILELLREISSSKAGADFVRALRKSQGRQRGGIRNLMEQNFHRDLKIYDYAHLSGRSHSTFHRDFKLKFGVAPKKWLLEKRMSRAKEILINQPGISIGSLAMHSGYANTSHFIKQFQAHFHTTPKQLVLSIRG